MSPYKVILVDDEESARSILSSLLKSHCPDLEVVAKCEDLEEGVLAIREHKPDLVFLDIEMPNYAGYEIATFFDQIDFEIVFVTAYDSYAIKAFELSAVDYLLKPIDINRLKEAIDKFKSRADSKTAAENYQVLLDSLKEDKVKKIVVQVTGGQKVIDVNDIVAFEANESYCQIHTVQGDKFIYSKNLKHFEKLLIDNSNFIRTHKSWIVNTDYMVQYSKSGLTIQIKGGLEAKLSKYKMEQFESAVLH